MPEYHDPRDDAADIYEMLATRRPATTLVEQSRQRVLMERAVETRRNRGPITSPALVEHVLMTRSAIQTHAHMAEIAADEAVRTRQDERL